MSEIAIICDGLSKQYRIGERESYKALRDVITDAAAAPFRRLRSAISKNGNGTSVGSADPFPFALSPSPEIRNSNSEIRNSFWALQDVSFEVKRGEVVGIIGRNGAGKSTLLKILSRITKPTKGHAEIHGRVGSLLEVGTGFHPELTGRENIYLNAAILGMRKAEVAKKFDEIVAFAEVEQFIDTPVKRYSSGMYVRLAFAVAAHMETEVLLIDEVLAVGDAQFRTKCLGKMSEVAQYGRTVLFVSHDLSAVNKLAPASLVLEEGRVGFLGPTNEAIRRYTSIRRERDSDLSSRKDRVGEGLLRMTEIKLTDSAGTETHNIVSGQALTISIAFESSLTGLMPEDIALDIRFTDSLGHPVTTFSTRFGKRKLEAIDENGILTCIIPSLPLAEDAYFLDLWLAYRGVRSDYIERAADVQVTTVDYFETGESPVKQWHGASIIAHEWRSNT